MKPSVPLSPAAALQMPLSELLRRSPHMADFFSSLGIGLPSPATSPADHFASLGEEVLEDLGIGRESLGERFSDFLTLLERLDKGGGGLRLEALTIHGGRDKSGRPEAFTLTVRPGDVICIVGPTGSGKSRFLADIEWLAQGDTPTGRTVLIDGVPPEAGRRCAGEQKLVAQLSQNMNFVIDLTVAEFVAMHAESRMVEGVDRIVGTVIDLANSLAGERFTPDTPVTALSGGQSRALMIADTACLSSSPIVLIDEIENAGIDRKRAVATLVDSRKIVLMATHDPILALMGGRRLVFRNGGVKTIIETNERERASLSLFEEMDARLNAVRHALRNGETIEGI